MILRLQYRRDHDQKYGVRMVDIDLEHMVENPLSNIPKDKLPMINGWENISPVGARNNIHTTHLNCLILDIDNSIKDKPTIRWADFLKLYKDRFLLYMYTTSSHTPEQHKFRCLFPLQRNIEHEEWRVIRNVLRKEFVFADNASFSYDQGMYVPNDVSGNYRYYYNDDIDTLLDIKKVFRKEIMKEHIIEADRKRIELQKEQYYKENPTFKDKSPEIIEQFNSILANCGPGEVYAPMMELITHNSKYYSELLYELLENSNYKNKRNLYNLLKRSR